MSLFNNSDFFKPVKKVVVSDTKPESCHLPQTREKNFEILTVQNNYSKEYPVGFDVMKELFISIMSKNGAWRDSDLDRASCARIYSTCENITRRFDLVTRLYAEELFDNSHISYDEYKNLFNARSSDAKSFRVIKHTEEICGVRIDYTIRVFYGSLSNKRSNLEKRYEQIEDLVYGYEGVD